MSFNINEFMNGYDAWNFSSFNDKVAQLEQSLNFVPAALKPVIQYHINCARHHIGDIKLLNGPTGETNELYTLGRGLTVIHLEERSTNGMLSATAMLTCALLAGNPCVIIDQHAQLTDLVKGLNRKISVVSSFTGEEYTHIMASDIRNYAYIGPRESLLQVNQELTQRQGVIVNLTYEVDFEHLPQANDTALVLRFITEKTRTINVTAIGGNAQLIRLIS